MIKFSFLGTELVFSKEQLFEAMSVRMDANAEVDLTDYEQHEAIFDLVTRKSSGLPAEHATMLESMPEEEFLKLFTVNQ